MIAWWTGEILCDLSLVLPRIGIVLLLADSQNSKLEFTVFGKLWSELTCFIEEFLKDSTHTW